MVTIPPRRSYVRALLFAGASLLYTALAFALGAAGIGHARLILVVAQLVIVLPAAVMTISTRHDPMAKRVDLDRRVLYVIAAIVAVVVVVAAHWWARGILWGDEAAYRFQARIFASGHLWADGAAPDLARTATSGAEPIFTHHIAASGHWFTKYPPLWPMVLAPAQAIGLGWIVNPILAGLVVLIVMRIARDELDAPPRLAAATMIASPFFFLMAASEMSHLLALALTAGATLCFLSGRRTKRAGPLALAIALVGACVFVRPYSAVCDAVALAPFYLGLIRREKSLRVPVIVWGALIGAATIGLMAVYNAAYTGHALQSPYALYRGTSTPVELSFSPHVIGQNLIEGARWSIQDTMLFTWPLLFVLAGWTLVVDRDKRNDGSVLASVFAVTLVATLFHTEGSSSRFGDRYLFEALFAPVVLGARGAALLLDRWRIPVATGRALFAGLAAVMVATAVTQVPPVFREIKPYVAVHDAVDALPDDGSLVFFPVTDAFTGDRFDLNAADWASAPHLFLVDPGDKLRAAVAKAEHRDRWIVIGWDDDAREVKVLASSATPTSTPAK